MPESSIKKYSPLVSERPPGKTVWRSGTFISRPNRFTLILKDREPFRAYLPNTGRLEEFCTRTARFHAVPFDSARFRWRAVSSSLGGSPVLIDTVSMNCVGSMLIRLGHVPELRLLAERATGSREIPKAALQSEKKLGRSRFDHYLKIGEAEAVVEVKTCTLVHRSTGLFPDAPSARAVMHIEHLRSLARSGMTAVMIFIIPGPEATGLIPNFHTDPVFASMLAEASGEVVFRAFRVGLLDPVTVDPSDVTEVPVMLDRARGAKDRGSYVIVLHNVERSRIRVGALGEIGFEPGYYVYVGSGMGGLDGRIKRHGMLKKKHRWHIDYIAPRPMKIVKSYPIRREDRIEGPLASRMNALCNGRVRGFGASDSAHASHLFYFYDPPHENERFISALLDFKTFTGDGSPNG